MDNVSNDYVKGVVEALLYINERPITLEQIKGVLKGVGSAEIRKIIDELKEEYEMGRKGMVIMEIAGGHQMFSSPHYASAIRDFFKTRVKEKLSRPALEALAIIAYKQPVARSDIEVVRGVNSDGVVMHLLNRGLIKIVGRKDVPGRPYLYGTTKLFLEYFGLRALEDLPRLEDIPILPTEQEPAKIILEEIVGVPQEEGEEKPGEGSPIEESSEATADAADTSEPEAKAEESVELKEEFSSASDVRDEVPSENVIDLKQAMAGIGSGEEAVEEDSSSEDSQLEEDKERETEPCDKTSLNQ